MKAVNFKIQRLIVLIRYLSIVKIINSLKLILLYLISFSKFHRIQGISPCFISVEVTNYCNLHCPECPVGKSKMSKADKSSFNLDLFKILIDELKPTLQHVILYFQGEPFLSNQLIPMIQCTHDARIYSSTSTNGQFLTDEIARELVLSGLDKLIVSMDGSTQEVYESYRVGGNLQKVQEGIRYIIEWKKEFKSITPLIELQFLVLGTNEHQMKDIKLMAKSLHVDRLTFKTAQLYDVENGNELLTTKDRFARYKKGKDGKYHIKGNQPNHCWRLWSGAVINVVGEVLPCCFDKSSEYSFGNINDSSLSNCWKGEKASGFRDQIIKNRKQVEICRNCTSK